VSLNPELALLLQREAHSCSGLEGGSVVLARHSDGSGHAVSGHCDACTLAQRIACHSDASAAEEADEDVVVLGSPDRVGLVVIPRDHVGGLEELPPLQRGRILAALRRASLSIGDRYPGSSTRVVVLADAPASEGHVCFQVLPSNQPGPSVASGLARMPLTTERSHH
jgi:hypothetical protein